MKKPDRWNPGRAAAATAATAATAAAATAVRSLCLCDRSERCQHPTLSAVAEE